MIRKEYCTGAGLFFTGVCNLFKIQMLLVLSSILWSYGSNAQSLDLAVHNHGISFGNSRQFTGLRFNVIDNNVEELRGVNITFLKAKNNDDAVVKGVSFGLVAPEAGTLRGFQIGGLGVGAKEELTGISFGLFGAGSGGSLNGITMAGIGAGAGGGIHGITFALIGAGAGGSIRGITIAGIGAGTGGNLTGITLAGIGAGAGGDISGITFGGIGAGAGGSIHGITVGLVGSGAGRDMSGIAFGGVGAGCGGTLTGVALAGIGIGAPEIRGVSCAVGAVKADAKEDREGRFVGLSVSAFNKIEGKLNGVSLGIVNYAYRLKGVQLGVINYVRDNPRYLRILPVINARLK